MAENTTEKTTMEKTIEELKAKLKAAKDAASKCDSSTLAKVGKVGLGVAVIAGAALGVAIPAIVALVGTMGTLAVGAGIISAPVIALGAVVGGVAYAMFENWDWLSEQWDMLCNAMSLAT